MSRIDDKTIDHIAKLANLEFNDKEKEGIRKDLNQILGFVDQLNAIDTEGVEPLIYMNEEQDSLREDKVTYQIPQEEALRNAPDKDSDYFKVPKVLKRNSG